MMRALLTASLLAAFTLSIAGCAGRPETAAPVASAEAQAGSAAACGPRASVVHHLRENYGEQLTAVGIVDGGGAVIELHVSRTSWTLLQTLPNGVSCLLSTGEGWHAAAARPAPPNR